MYDAKPPPGDGGRDIGAVEQRGADSGGQPFEAGLVESERQGLWAYYYVMPGVLDELAAWLA